MWMAAVVFIETLVTTWVVVRLPDSVPMHWNLAGEVDRYGSPWEFELLGPPTTLLVGGLLIGLSLIPRIGRQLVRSGPMYGRIAMAIVAGLGILHLAAALPIAQAALPERDGPHGPVTVERLVSPMIITTGVLFMVLGNWMGKVRRNPLFGVRSTSTLASDAVWERTQRWSGRLFVLLGLMIALTAILCPLWATAVVTGGGTLVWCAVSHIYSWRLARSERASVIGEAHLPPGL
jgi:uncharacterized membrane protein